MPKDVDLSEYDEETLAKAFWLQEHIRRYGIDGIHFMWRARGEAHRSGPEQVADAIESELKKV